VAAIKIPLEIWTAPVVIAGCRSARFWTSTLGCRDGRAERGRNAAALSGRMRDSTWNAECGKTRS
jgi:hypothetical protein